MFFYRAHGEGLLPVFARTYAGAGAAAGTIHFRNGDRKSIILHAGHGKSLHALWSIGIFFLSHSHRADDCMGAYERAAAALNAVFRFPDGHFRSHIAPFVGGAS